MTHLFTIQNDTVIIDKLVVSEINSDITLRGNTQSYGSFNILGDISTKNIIADTLRVKELISDTTDFGNWSAKTFDELNGKGIRWSCEEGETQLIYRTGSRLWTSSNIDIPVSSSFMIDNIPVLTSNTLGQTITKSNLRQVGALNALSVIGPSSLSGFAYFDDITNRLGLGTTDPNASISIVDNNVEISIGSPSVSLATIGTYSSHDLSLITDNIPRVTIKQSGEVQIGDELYKSGVLRVYGSIYADQILSDTRVTRCSSLEFDSSRDDNAFNKGLVWNSYNTKSLLLIDSPSRLLSTESIDVANGNSYYINGTEALSSDTLGAKILNSSLVKLGNLQDLTVDGVTTLNGNVILN
jgi:hypothetical protein